MLATLDSTDADTHFHLALIYARRMLWDRAEEHFGKAVALKPDGFWIYQGFGHAKLAAGRLPEAEHLLKTAASIKSFHSPTLVDLGRLYERRSEFAKAEEYFYEAIEADQNNAFAYHAYAKYLLQAGMKRD